MIGGANGEKKTDIPFGKVVVGTIKKKNAWELVRQTVGREPPGHQTQRATFA